MLERANVFVTGAALFPQNSCYNPTGTVGALAYWTADAIKRDYLRALGTPDCFMNAAHKSSAHSSRSRSLPWWRGRKRRTSRVPRLPGKPRSQRRTTPLRVAGSQRKAKALSVASSSCHGANGVPPAGVPFPYLADMPAEYLAKQLFDYRDGRRANAVMESVAKALTDADIASLARHYASLKAPTLKGAPPNASKPARQLQEIGDVALAGPGCGNYHRPAGADGGPLLPPFAAQPAAYTTSQLNAFRGGERKTTKAKSCAVWSSACRMPTSRH
jgi:cytochrome c553